MSWISSGKVCIACGSCNPVKTRAAARGVERACFPVAKVEVSCSGYDVDSGVSDQPIGDEETKRGAINRACAAWEAHVVATGGEAPDFSVGLEGGIVDDGDSMLCIAWMSVFDGKMHGTARTCSFALPARMAQLVRDGMELGDADDQVMGTVGAKQGAGTVGALTRGVIDRSEYYEPAVVLAMVPLLWKGELYEVPS